MLKLVMVVVRSTTTVLPSLVTVVRQKLSDHDVVFTTANIPNICYRRKLLLKNMCEPKLRH